MTSAEILKTTTGEEILAIIAKHESAARTCILIEDALNNEAFTNDLERNVAKAMIATFEEKLIPLVGKEIYEHFMNVLRKSYREYKHTA